jgi:hypothetical protein
MTSTGARRKGVRATGQGGANWTLRTLIARHKRFSLGLLAVIVVMLAVFVVTILGPSAGSVTDSTTCSGWGSSNQHQQRAYASSYVSEHGPLKSGATDPVAVEAAINKGCGQAFDNDVADSITIYQAINNQY